LSILILEEYAGPTKIAMVTINGEEVPDPRIYVQHPKKTLIERKHAKARFVPLLSYQGSLGLKRAI
jgi:hypothetical protein